MMSIKVDDDDDDDDDDDWETKPLKRQKTQIFGQ